MPSSLFGLQDRAGHVLVPLGFLLTFFGKPCKRLLVESLKVQRLPYQVPTIMAQHPLRLQVSGPQTIGTQKAMFDRLHLSQRAAPDLEGTLDRQKAEFCQKSSRLLTEVIDLEHRRMPNRI